MFEGLGIKPASRPPERRNIFVSFDFLTDDTYPGMHRPENTEGQEEKNCGSVDARLKGHLVIEFRLKKGKQDNFGVIAIVV